MERAITSGQGVLLPDKRKKQRSVTVAVNSRDRNLTADYYPNSVRWTFRRPLKDVVSIELVNGCIPADLYNVASTFERKSQIELAIQSYELALILDPKFNFNFQMAQLYGQIGQTDLMIEKYLLEAHTNPQNNVVIQNQLTRFITEDADVKFTDALKKALILRTQQSQDIFWNEYLSWFYVQQKEFGKAFIQQKAIYKRNPETFFNILNLAQLAKEDGDKETAIAIYTNVAGSSNVPEWRLQTDTLHYSNPTGLRQVLSFNPADLPSVGDFDNDGDADILFVKFGALTLNLIRSNAVEANNRSQLDYYEVSRCAGQIATSSNCNQYSAAICRVGADTFPQAPLHLGSALLYKDLDGDQINDLILGDIGCNDANFFKNLGTTIAPRFATTAPISAPTINRPLTKQNFPAFYSIDANQDGMQDLVMASNEVANQYLEIDEIRSATLFKQVGVSPNYEFQRPNFLQDQMLDLGSYASPTFADIDQDGDFDMVVGKSTTKVGTGIFSSRLALFMNEGTPQQAKFFLADSNWLNLESLRLTNYKPIFGDLTNDGKPDLVMICNNFNTGSGQVVIFKNTAIGGGPWQFSVSNIQRITNLGILADSPAITDIDADGFQDLLIGSFDGTLTLLKNTGNLTQFGFTLLTNVGNINPTNSIYGLRIAIADLDRDQLPDLMASNQGGRLLFYPNIRSWYQQNAPSPVSLLLQKQSMPVAKTFSFASDLSIAIADLDADGFPDLGIGTTGGGVVLLQNTSPTVSLPLSKISTKLTASPNPVQYGDVITIYSESKLEVSNVLGQQLFVDFRTGSDGFWQMSTENLRSGVYFLSNKIGQKLQIVVTK
jgi:hypothetical protein